VISEIVTNSIRHGSTDGRDRVGIEIVASANQLTGKVRDNWPPFEPRFDLPDAEHVGGYGLHIAQSLSTLTVSRTATGNIVTFTVS
jgi:anti-sigma regulatory factor (Ser/Thr protein kinase)